MYVSQYMRPFGISRQLARRRRRALSLLRHGWQPIGVAQQVGVTAQSVRRWRRDAKRSKPPHKLQRRAPGRPSRLATAQQGRLLRALTRGAYAYGYAEDYWTLDRIAHLIWERFRVRYRTSGVWYLLQRLGWSCQKPQRRSLARDDEAIAHRKHYIWPHIKKVA